MQVIIKQRDPENREEIGKKVSSFKATLPDITLDKDDKEAESFFKTLKNAAKTLKKKATDAVKKLYESVKNMNKDELEEAEGIAKDIFDLYVAKVDESKKGKDKNTNAKESQPIAKTPAMNDRADYMKKLKAISHQLLQYASKLAKSVGDDLTVTYNLDRILEYFIKLVNLLAPTRVDIPCDFDANKKTVLRMFGYEKKLTISQAKWGDCTLEGLNFVKQERDYGNSEIKLERIKVITTRVFASLRNLEYKIGHYKLKLVGVPLVSGSITLVCRKIAVGIELIANYETKTCEEFLKGKIELNSFRGIQFEFQGGLSLNDGLKNMFLNFITFFLKFILRFGIRYFLNDALQDVLRDVNPYC